MKNYKHFIIFSLCCMAFNLKANNKFVCKTDSVSPLRFLNAFFEKSLNDNTLNISLDSYIDSIVLNDTLTKDEIGFLTNFKKMYRLESDDYPFLIDSILDLDSIPPNLMFAIDYCLNLLFDRPSNEDFGCNIYADNDVCSYPSSGIYNNIWCQLNPNPYPVSLYENDSIIELKLINDSNEFKIPCIAPVTSKYGWRDGKIHQGIDLGINYSHPVSSAFAGVVRYANFHKGYGRLVIIRHYNGLETYYAHLSRINVKPGQYVKVGEMIGKSGSSGRSSGPHLHFEMRYKGVPLNPAHIISFADNKLFNDKIILKRVKQNFFVYNENAILYSVQNGDYLSKIAKEYGVSMNKLCEANDLSKNSRLKTGQLIRIAM